MHRVRSVSSYRVTPAGLGANPERGPVLQRFKSRPAAIIELHGSWDASPERRCRMTVRAIRWIGFLAAFAVVATAGPVRNARGDESGKQVRFERFKQLAGDWVAKGG